MKRSAVTIALALVLTGSLASALGAQARKAPVAVTVEDAGVGRVPQEVEAAVYFCALEALQNTAKYAHASHASVRLERRDGFLRFSVADDGHGFDPAVTSYGTGLQGIADRLGALEGTMDVSSIPGQGTVIEGVVPIGAATAEPLGASSS